MDGGTMRTNAICLLCALLVLACDDDDRDPPLPDAASSDATAPDATAPDPDGAAPDPDATAPDPDGAAPDPDATAPDPDAATPDPDAPAPDPDAASPDPDAASPDPDAAAPELDAEPPDATPDAMISDPDAAVICHPGVEITLAGAAVPPEMAGHYREAFDCAREEGGAWFGGVDFAHCFRKDDGSAWRIWNTGCGWEVGRLEPRDGRPGELPQWERYARTYSGQCAAIPAAQLDTRALTTATFYDGFGRPLDGIDATYDACGEAPQCHPGVEITLAGAAVPPGMAGHYREAFDCAREEGGAWFGGVDFAHCFRKDDGSAWRIWNTGCGWEIGRLEPRDGRPGEPPEWQRYARTYTGQCAAIPPAQFDTRALTTATFYNGFGEPIPGIEATYDDCGEAPQCRPGVEITLAGAAVPPEMAGHYREAFDCAREEGGAWFGGVDFAHCFRKDDGSAWRIWNTGCGWEIGRLEPRDGRPGEPPEWQRYARTYTGQCAAIPPAQLDTRALTTATFYNGFGEPIPGIEATYDDCGEAPQCRAGVEITLAGAAVPPEMAGHYREAFDCAREEGGAWFGGVDFAHCFRKDDGSAWRIWNTGCGWEVGRLEPRDGRPGDLPQWERYARTYSGQCATIPAAQLDTRALTTATFYNGFGGLLDGIDATYDACGEAPECRPGVEITLAGAAVPPGMAGHYREAFDCAREEGGAWFGGVDFAHCFRKDDGSTWRIWNTGCGWEVGRLEPRDGRPGEPPEWERYARTYSGQCAAIPAAQLDTRALTTVTFYDGFGGLLAGIEAAYCPR